MRNLYIRLFESNIIENSPLNEGAWGYGILDNDSALDSQTEFGSFSLNLLTTKIQTSKTSDEKWANLGVLVDFLKKYDHDDIRFNDDYNAAIELCKYTVNSLSKDKHFITSWRNESKIKSELKRIYRDLLNITYDKDRLNEDGEGAMVGNDGATNTSSSGGYTTVIGGGSPLRQKTLYITQEQHDAIKKALQEEAEMNTAFGNFGYDAPVGDGKKNKGNKFFAAANDHKNMMKKSWTDEK